MMERVTIVALGESDEATALRAVLEAMDMETRLMRVRASQDVSPALSAASQSEVVILSAEGGEAGFQLKDATWIPPAEAFKGVTFSDDAVLISTAGSVRESGLVDVMFSAGGHLIAPNGAPDRRIIVPWIAACLLRADAGLADAVHGANMLVEPKNRFSYG